MIERLSAYRHSTFSWSIRTDCAWLNQQKVISSDFLASVSDLTFCCSQIQSRGYRRLKTTVWCKASPGLPFYPSVPILSFYFPSLSFFLLLLSVSVRSFPKFSLTLPVSERCKLAWLQNSFWCWCSYFSCVDEVFVIM